MAAVCGAGVVKRKIISIRNKPERRDYRCIKYLTIKIKKKLPTSRKRPVHGLPCLLSRVSKPCRTALQRTCVYTFVENNLKNGE